MTNPNFVEREVFRNTSAVVYYRPQWHEFEVLNLETGVSVLVNDQVEAEEIANAYNS